MNETIKELEAAFKLLSTVAVSGDAVDVMAMVRNKLRKIHAELKKMEVEQDG